MGLVDLLFSFKGRINRRQYWFGSFGAGVGGALLFFFATLIATPDPAAAKGAVNANQWLAIGVIAVVWLGLCWCGLAIQVKRFHDRGRSGLWALAPAVPVTMIFATIIGGVAADAPASSVIPQIMPWFGVLGLINLWLFVDLGLLAGTDGPNKYDDAPGGGGGAGAAAFLLGGAQNAIDRAIEARAMPAAAAPTRGVNLGAPAQAPAFGRRAPR